MDVLDTAKTDTKTVSFALQLRYFLSHNKQRGLRHPIAKHFVRTGQREVRTGNEHRLNSDLDEPRKRLGANVTSYRVLV